jgi:hypothetical protein
MSRTTMVAALFLAVTGVACKEKPKAEPTPPPIVETARAVEPTPASVNVDREALAQVPVTEDFEEQANREVTAANLDSEIDKLDREIAE